MTEIGQPCRDVYALVLRDCDDNLFAQVSITTRLSSGDMSTLNKQQVSQH